MRFLVPASFLLLTIACTPVGHLGITPEDSATPEGDTDTDTDADGDTDADADADTDADSDIDYFRPDYLSVRGYVGVAGTEIVDWSYDGSTTMSYIGVELAPLEYFHTGDTSLNCYLYFEPLGTAVSAGDHLLAWEVEWLPLMATDLCYQLDPDYYGAYPIEDIGVSMGSMAIAPMNEFTEELLEESWDTDYFDDNALGLTLELGDLDATIESFWDYYPDLQLYYGWAYGADADMAVDLEELVPPARLGGDTHAFLMFSSLHYETPDHLLD